MSIGFEQPENLENSGKMTVTNTLVMDDNMRRVGTIMKSAKRLKQNNLYVISFYEN